MSASKQFLFGDDITYDYESSSDRAERIQDTRSHDLRCKGLCGAPDPSSFARECHWVNGHIGAHGFFEPYLVGEK